MPHLADRPRANRSGITAVAALAVVAPILLAGCSSTSGSPAATPSITTVSLPDVVGKPGDIAQEELRSLGFTVSLDGGDQSVWQPANWVVERQEPVAGDVVPSSAVTLHLGRPPEPDAEPWDEITDGTWERGDYALGETVTPRKAVVTDNLMSDFEYTVTGPPTLTTRDGGETVTMSSPLVVTRIQEAWPEDQVSDSVRLFFVAGTRPESQQYNETWGTGTVLECDTDTLTLGESASCSISFTAPASAIQDSHWSSAYGPHVAAWPSQVP